MSPVIELNDVSFSYGGPPVLHDITFSVEAGEFVALIGPNGGGKTTLLKLMLGLLKPSRGTVRVFGRHPKKARQHIGYVPQDIHLNLDFPISALEVVLMGMIRPRKRWIGHPENHRQIALSALGRMGVAEYAGIRIGDLSGGERQRVFIARALVTRPKLLLLDEPTASIDTKGQTDFFDLLSELNREITIVVVSHDLLAISNHVKSVACVNRALHYHRQDELSGKITEAPCPCTVEELCPVGMVTRGTVLPTVNKRKN